MSVNEFNGKVALITGGAGGMGQALARSLAADGVSLALLDNSAERLAEIAEQFPNVATIAADVTRLGSMQAAVAEVEDRFGRIDYVISVAGGGLPRSIETMTEEEWHRTVDLNLSGPFNVVKASAPALRRAGGGSIVVVASLASLGISLNSGVSYTAAKAGLLGLVRHTAYELASDNIRVNAVLPGAVLTEQMANKISEQTFRDVPKRSPIQRWITPEEIAGPIRFFCADASSAVTGAHLLVDGGWMINGPEDREAYFRQRGHEN